jgi:hypothetical protein
MPTKAVIFVRSLNWAVRSAIAPYFPHRGQDVLPDVLPLLPTSMLRAGGGGIHAILNPNVRVTDAESFDRGSKPSDR